MNYPKRAIADLRAICARDSEDSSSREVLAYLDWLEGKHVCEWPRELTRERLEELANDRYLCQPNQVPSIFKCTDALRALAAIAPQRKKRVVNIWNDGRDLQIKAADWAPFNQRWRKVAGPIEIED